jgi:hypothetical protein
VDSPPEEEWNLRPSPPEHTQNELENGEGKKHVGSIEKVSDKECDRKDRKQCEYETRNDGQEKQENRRPKRDLRLGRRQFATSAVGTSLGVSRVHVQFGAELDVIAPPTKIAEQRFPDSGPIAVVTIFHGIF